MPARLSLVSAIMGTFLAATPTMVFGQQGYRPPNLEKQLFDPSGIELDRYDRAGLICALVSVANDFNQSQQVDFELRAHALAIAARLDMSDSEVKSTLENLKNDGKTYGPKGDKKWVSHCLASGIDALRAKGSNKDNLTCAAYCADIAARLEAGGTIGDQMAQLKRDLTRAGHKADWTGMLGDVIRHAPNPWDPPDDELADREVPMPGGKADSFKLQQSRVNCLVVKQLPTGDLAGAASTLNATALKDGGRKGVLFTFNQKVGPMMGGSLEEVVKYLRVRHENDPGLIPDGYRVELGFENKYMPKDGPSAATAFALVLDSLISGEELDDHFACTGDITADGMVQKIGGAAGKIRGATNRGCRIVGIPVRNSKEMSDVLLLDGPAPLLDIQVFTMKDFNDAHALGLAKKPAEIQSGLDSFNAVASEVKSAGPEKLKDAAVQRRLARIADDMPNHLSARLLADFGAGKHQKTLSIRGSLEEIDQDATPVFRNIVNLMRPKLVEVDGEIKALESVRPEGSERQIADAKEAIEKLEKLHPLLDERIKPYNEAALKTCSIFAKGPGDLEDPVAFVLRLRSGMESFARERTRLFGDTALMEEIMN